MGFWSRKIVNRHVRTTVLWIEGEAVKWAACLLHSSWFMQPRLSAKTFSLAMDSAAAFQLINPSLGARSIRISYHIYIFFKNYSFHAAEHVSL